MLTSRSTVPLVALFILTVAASLPVASSHAPGLVLSAFGTANVEGVIAANEPYDCVSGSNPAGPGYTFRFCEMNDERNDYYALEVDDRTSDGIGDVFKILFDDEHDGVVPACGPLTAAGREDGVFLDAGGAFFDFFDFHYCVAGSAFDGPPGEPHGSGALVFAGGVGYVYELSHPLCSGDTEDYCLTPGSTVGWCLEYIDANGANPTFSFDFPANCVGAGIFRGDASGYGDIVKCCAAVGGQLLPNIATGLSPILLAITALAGSAIAATLMTFKAMRRSKAKAN